MGFRRAAKVDSNHTLIVKQLRQIGCSVLNLHTIKNAFDILVGFQGKTFLFEIKTDHKKKMTEGELKFADSWRGSKVHIITNFDEAIQIINT